jgi:hypothetical protein
MTQSIGALLLASVVAVLFVANPASRANYADWQAQAIGMSGDAGQKFMNLCLARQTATPNCGSGKPCGNSLHREG